MILEKVYDELYGMIEDLKKQIQTAKKSDVTITPALESGTKVADFEIDGTEGSIYMPQIQSNAAATSLDATSLPDGQTITSVLNFEVVDSDVTDGLGWVLYALGHLRLLSITALTSAEGSILVAPEGHRPVALQNVMQQGYDATNHMNVNLVVARNGYLTNFNASTGAQIHSFTNIRGTLLWSVLPLPETRSKKTTKKTTKKED